MNTLATQRCGTGLYSRLSMMMFLQYAIWGAWLPLLYPFLKNYREFSDADIGSMFMVGGVGAIFGPFIAGQIADRWFNTEIFLGISHLLGAVVVWMLASVETVNGFLIMSLIYSLIYSPTIALTNSLAFHHIPDRDRDFGPIRLWGTIGWIVVGIGIGQWLLYSHTPAEGTEAQIAAQQAVGMTSAFKLSAILGIVMGIFCFTLPRTPPQKGEESFATVEAIKEVRRNPLLMLFLLAVPVSMIHQFYFVYTSQFLGAYQASAEGLVKGINAIFGVGGGGLMTIGQMTEIAVLAMIPLFALRLTRKTLLGIGLLAYFLRMAIFTWVGSMTGDTGNMEIILLILGVALHGLCFGCFIFVAFMIVDEECSGDIKASAQNLFNLVIVGIGIVVGSWVAGQVGEWAVDPVLVDGVAQLNDDGTPETIRNWPALFSVPMWGAVACLIALLLFYPGGRRSADGT